ncbi:hypothetical protein L3Y34_007695 [Caenorhabditis briggsae]|uniref:Proteasome activator complex subunit 4 n=2 Tax=Caenorhabditis briggsae TaxID=6238 RepID=A0AAE9A0X9_CAEBR|nr:hypothetical protein L3Y34_007695 [Caenorhabditis briggsae]
MVGRKKQMASKTRLLESDSEDDISSSGSVTEAEDLEEDIDMEDLDTTELENAHSDEDGLETEEMDKKREKHFCKEIWQLKKLPYSDELEEQANRHFQMIKKGLAESILLNDAATGFCHWTMELDKYIDFYGRRFSKEEHIQLIHIFLPLVKKGAIFRNVKIAMRTLYTLLSKKDFLTRQDLVIDWRPLMELYVEVTFKNLEEDGLFLMPDGFRSDLHTLIFYSRPYFSDESVQELLDEVRPFMCVWDESCLRYWKLMDLFLCTAMPVQRQLTHGSALWLDEAWYWYEQITNNSLFETQAIKMFARLSVECPGHIDWTGKLDLIFSRLLRALRLGHVTGLCQVFNQEYGSIWLVFMMGTKAHDKLMSHMRDLFNQVESFLHPSNNGLHTQHIMVLLSKLLSNTLLRLKRERSEKSPKSNRTLTMIPDEMRLTQAHLDELVTMMLPSLKLIAFTKTCKELVSPAYRSACLLCPKIILPIVLDMVYPALETLVEPHRLLQTLGTLLGVLIPLVKDEPDAEGKTYRTHVITILNSLLPGLDCNDISKCMVTYQIIGVIVNMIPIVDCSEAVHVRCDLTEDEKELCSATANFDSIISMLMDRMFEMLIAVGQTATTSGTHGSISAKTGSNIEDQIFHRGTLSVFKGICRNSSTELFNIAINKLYSVACEHVFDSRIANDVIGDMIQVACKFHPDIAFHKFFKLVISKIQNCITPEFYTEEKVEFGTLWWIAIASRMIKVHPKLLLENWHMVSTLMDLVMPNKKCTTATEKALNVMDNLLDQLTSIQINSLAERRKMYDLSTEQFLAIRHWAAPVEKKNWNPEWIIPTHESIDRATQILRKWLVPTIDSLNAPTGIPKKELLHRLYLVRSALLGSCFSLPLLEGKLIPLSDSHIITPENEMMTIVKPKGTPEISIDGKNVRKMILDCTVGLINWLLENNPDDVKSIQESISILRSLPLNRGYTRELYNTSSTSYRVTKTMLCDKLAGNKSNIEMIVEEYVMLLHRKRIAHTQGWHFNEHHKLLQDTLLKVATSTYSENRSKAQAILLSKLREHPYSYKLILNDIISFLQPGNDVSHEQLKGALYLLIDGKKQSLMLRMEFEQQAKMWPALVKVQHSEKPTIIALLENAQNMIVDNYESYRLKYEWEPKHVEAAWKLLRAADESSPLHNAEMLRGPSEAELEKYKNLLTEKYEKSKANYFSLINELFALANDPTLHWRPLDMAYSMLSMQVRRDCPLPDNVVKMFVRLLINDTVKTRRIASAVVASWLKMTKPKAVKREYVIPYKAPNTSTGAMHPIPYGFRSDNRIMMYEEDKLPKTDEEWDSFQFCCKQNWGAYTWPAKLRTYAPLKEQNAIDRNYEDFSDVEKYIVEMFQDEKFMTRFRELFSIEMKKEDELFNAVNFSLFQGLFRCYGDVLTHAFRAQLELLLQSTKEYEQKLAAEITAGMINGSKLWKYEKQRKLWNWLDPLLTKTFEIMKEDGLRNWGVAIATVCGCSEARMLKPLIDLLFKLIERPTDNAYAASSRMFLVQSALCQFEWRGVELWNKLVDMMKGMLVQPFANLRDRIAISLVSATWYDLPAVCVDPSLPKRLQPPRIEEISALYQDLLGTCFDEVRMVRDIDLANGYANGSSSLTVPTSSGGMMTQSASSASLAEVSEVKKQSRLTLRAAISFVFNTCNQSYNAYPPSFLQFIPLWCHYSNDVGDEELQKTCSSLCITQMEAIYISPENAPEVIRQFQQILSTPCWWKAKVAALKMVRMLVFSNRYVFRIHRDDVGIMLVNALNDNQIEVREKAAEALSTLLQSKFFETTPELVSKFSTAANSQDMVKAHGGVMGLSAIVLAFPYSVPPLLPGVLMTICRFATDKNAIIREAVKRTLSEFKRTHQDSWREHEQQFNEDQLMVLRDLLISPNYYV